MSAAQERAERAARALVLAVTQLNEPKDGEYALELRIVRSPDGITYSWDWWWRPLGISRGETGIASIQLSRDRSGSLLITGFIANL